MNERWVPITGWETLYEVSSHGRVRSLDRVVEMRSRWNGVMERFHPGRILQLVQGRGKGRGWAGSGDYCAVTLAAQKTRKRELVHRLVLTSFVGPDPGGLDGAHRDGNTMNNRLSNLRWATRQANMSDMKKQGRKIRGQAQQKEAA